jgi:hypothetical protein
MDLNEPVPETKKVTDFLSGITDSKLANAKDLILGDAAKLQDFEVCQQYLKTLIHNKSTQEKHDRHISAVAGFIPDGGKLGGKKGKKEKGKRKGEKSKDLLTKNYTKEEWFKLSAEQRERIKEARNAKKQRNEDKARQAAAAATGAVGQDPPTPTGQPGPVVPTTRMNLDWIRDIASAVTKEFNAGLAKGFKIGPHWEVP